MGAQARRRLGGDEHCAGQAEMVGHCRDRGLRAAAHVRLDTAEVLRRDPTAAPAQPLGYISQRRRLSLGGFGFLTHDRRQLGRHSETVVAEQDSGAVKRLVVENQLGDHGEVE